MLGACRPGSVGRHLCHSFGKGTLENEANTKENRATVETDYGYHDAVVPRATAIPALSSSKRR